MANSSEIPDSGKKPVSAGSSVEAAIRCFLESSREPALLEAGEELLPLRPGTFAIEQRHGKLVLQAWSQTRNLARRIGGVRRKSPGRLELTVERFGKREGQLTLLDLARADRPMIERRSERLALRERFRRLLARQFPQWKISSLSAEPNLEESLSPVYPRALIKQGMSGWAALISPSRNGAPAGILTFALIWLDYLRRRESGITVEGLALFLPEGQENLTCLRLRYIDPAAARIAVFVYSEEDYVDRVDPSDFGNLDTRVEPLHGPDPERSTTVESWVERLARLPFVETVLRNDGATSLRVRGLEFARATRAELVFGLQRRISATTTHLPEIERLAEEIARRRSPDASDHANPLYRLQPERWLESVVRAQIEQLDASLMPSPIYSQTPALAGADRGVLDLLAVECSGRLAVLELKASEDIHLPLQALDYWLRVKWHLERGEFAGRGYFQNVALRREPPRLLLIAPALEFHPSIDVILRFLSPEIEIERVGIALEWRRGLQVLFRARGARSAIT